MSEINENDIRHALSVLKAPGEVFEIRALDARKQGSYKTGTISGYFDNVNSCIAELKRLEAATGIYFTLNKIDPALLARRVNRLDYGGATTSDTNILRREWLILDADPVRPSGISSTDEEKQAARGVAREVYGRLSERGWPKPIVCDSGNGWHLLYRIDLPAQDGSLITRVINGVADLFGTDRVKIDRTMFNPSRIAKLYGTLAAKGDATKERPHRQSKFVDVPPALEPVSEVQLRALADEWQPQQASALQTANAGWDSSFDMEEFLSRYGVAWKKRGLWRDGATKWELEQCPFCGNGRNGSNVFLFPDGRRGFKCQHNSCVEIGWKEFRAKVDTGYVASRCRNGEAKSPQITEAIVTETKPAEPHVQPCPLGELLEAVEAFLRRYVVFQYPEQAKVCALWSIHTWAFNAFDYTPYLSVFAVEKRSGKSRLLEVLSLLVCNARLTSGSSSAALIRSVDEDNPTTILLDEVDAVYSKKNDAEAENTRQFLNAGFRRGAKFLRCVGQGGALEVKEFPAFCPKALSGIGRCLPDTVLDRSLPVELVRQSREDRAERFREREAEAKVATIRAELEAWMQQPGLIDTLRDARPALPEELTDRQQDYCEPLLAIADMAGGDWPGRSRVALIKLCSQEEDASLGVKLLTDIKGIFDSKGTDKLHTIDILGALVAIEDDRPWATWWLDDLKHDKPEKPASRLAKLLKPYGTKQRPLKARLIRLSDKVARGYEIGDFKHAFERYLPPPEKAVTSVTTVTYERKPVTAQDNVTALGVTNGGSGHNGSVADTLENVTASSTNVTAPQAKGVTQIPLVERPFVTGVTAVTPFREGEGDGAEDRLIEDAKHVFNAAPAA